MIRSPLRWAVRQPLRDYAVLGGSLLIASIALGMQAVGVKPAKQKAGLEPGLFLVDGS